MRPFYFAIFVPAMVAIGVAVGLSDDAPTVAGRLMPCATSATCLLIPVGLANPRRFWWALRIVAVLVCVACVGYLWTEAFAWLDGKPFALGGRAAKNLRNAIAASAIFGVPAALHAVSGRGASLIGSLALRREAR